jgi:hypothetical protein
MAHHGKESEKSPEGRSVATPQVVACEAGRVDFTAAGGATVAAILHLVRLMGAELVLARGHDLAQFEHAVRAKLGEFTSPTADPEARPVASQRFTESEIRDHSAKERRAVRPDELVTGSQQMSLTSN